LLVAILVLGHVCELPAHVEAGHHHPDGAHDSTGDSSHEQPGFCDAVTAPSTSTQLHHVWTGLAVPATLPVVDASPVGATLEPHGAPARPASRPPLFLLHSSFLI